VFPQVWKDKQKEIWSFDPEEILNVKAQANDRSQPHIYEPDDQ